MLHSDSTNAQTMVTLNDTADTALSHLTLYRTLFNHEPRLIREISLRDTEMVDTSVILKQAEIIDQSLNQAGWVEGRDFSKTEFIGDGTNALINFFGKTFTLGIVHHDYWGSATFTFIACLGSEVYENKVLNGIIKQFEDRIGNRIKESGSKIYVINKTDNGLNLVNFPIRKNSSKDRGVEFEDLYNDDFFPVSEKIIAFLKTHPDERDSNGIIVLQGGYGTGKTNYLRHLIRHVNKKIIFLPPELSTELANPGFVTFFMDHPDSILIIEDAETVLKTREAGGNQAVANLLNMSDGILGDALSLQIVCTLNAESEHIDKALLREGRLIELYEFNELSKEKTERLFKKLHGEDAIPPKDELTLSQIFKCDDYKRKVDKESKKVSFGFV